MSRNPDKAFWPGGNLWPNCFTGWVLTGLALALPPVLLWAPKAIAPLYAVAALAALVDMGRGGWRGQAAALAGLGRTAWPLLALAVVALASALWSMDRGVSWPRALRLAVEVASLIPLLLMVSQLPAPVRQRISRNLLWGMAAALGFLLAEVVTNAGIGQQLHGHRGSPLSMFNRAVGVYVMLAPLVWMWTRRLHGRATAAGLVLAIGLAGLLLESMASSLAILAILVILLLSLAVPAPRLLRGLAAVTVAGVLTLPAATHFLARPEFVSPHHPPVSVLHRVHIWQFTTQKILERPLLGHGMDSSQLFHNNPELRAWVGNYPWPLDLLPNHPHNGVLQVWLELGALGALCVALLWHNLWRWAARLASPPLQILVTLALVADMVIWLTAYGAWQGQWLASVGWQVVFLQITLRQLQADPPASPGGPQATT